MQRTYTPELTPDVLERLADYAALFREHFQRHEQARWAHLYLHGLLHDGDRKSVEPMATRIPVPGDWEVRDPTQALQNFLNQSPWDDQALGQRYRRQMALTFASPEGVFLIDDTSFPKQGRHSVGVQRQYCGALGKTANCQVAVSVHYVAPNGHFPLAVQLYLPESWVPDGPLTRADHRRLEKAGVPPDQRWFRTKGQIALRLLDQVQSEGLPGKVVVADAGYGDAAEFRRGLSERGLHYVVGVKSQTIVFADAPRWEVPADTGRGRVPTRPRLTEDSPRPVSVAALAGRVRWQRQSWREGTQGKLSGLFAWVRVWPAQGWDSGACAGAEPIWLLIEEQSDGQIKYALSNLPERTSCVRGVRLWKSRWSVEQGYQQMKEELGLDHFEGRSWRGFHHHACLVMLALGFLMLERQRARDLGETPLPWLSLPSIRRGLQRLLAPRFPFECPHCHEEIQHPLLN